MQFDIENKITTKQTVTLDAPGYYKALGGYYFLTDKILIKVDSNSVKSVENGSSVHSMFIEDIVKYGKKLTQQVFEIEFDKQLKCLTEQYQSSIAMDKGSTDPKDQELDETKKQATEETDGEGKEFDSEGQGALVD